MSLDVVCPHCEFRLQLPMGMAGRTIRCPNPDCNTAFEVPPPVAEIIPASKPKPVVKPNPVPVSKPKEVRWSDEAVPATKPKEVRWNDAVEPKPKPKPAPRPRPVPAAETIEDDEQPILTTPRKKKINRSPMILAGLVMAVVFAGAGLAVFLFLSREREERKLAESAEQAYQSGDYTKARRDFGELVKNTADGEKQPRYEFLANLSQLQTDTQQLGAAGDPDEALASFAKFLEQYSESSFSKPGTGFGLDIVLLGQKLATVAHAFCLESLNEHRGNRGDTSKLDRATVIAKRTRALLTELERIRDKDSPSSKDVLQKLDALDASVIVERRRSDSLKEWRAKLSQPNQAVLDEFQTAMAKLGLAEDAGTVALLAGARRAIFERIRFMPTRRPAAPFPVGGPDPSLAAVPVAGSPRPTKSDAATEQTCFAVSEGCLFALDAHTGSFLWGRRIAEPTQPRSILDLPTIATLPGTTTDVALVAFPHGLAAFKMRSGEPVWYQALPAPCRAKPAVFGNRVFATLLNEAGTIAVLNLGTGEHLGSVALQQPHGANPQVLGSGSSAKPQLLAIGQARQAYLFEIGSGDSDALTCSAGIVTGHASSSVLVDPLVVPPGSPGRPTRMILMTANGSDGTKLTMYSLPADGAGSPASASEWVAPKILEKPLTGWPWYPMASDGERLAFATDSGTVGWYGWKSPADGLFPLLPEPVSEPGDTVSRSCIAAMADDTLWAVAGENLVRYQASVGAQGLRMIPVGKPRRVGEAVGQPQVFPRSNIAVVRIKPPGLGTHQLMAFDTDRGDILWQIELNVK